MYNLEYVCSLLANYRATPPSQKISPNETMLNEWYFDVGKYAIEVIAAALVSSKIHEGMQGPKVSKVLDIPCGHGRILRHLVKLFPEAEIHACDLDRDGLDFCASEFGARAIISDEDLTRVDFGCEYDVIWVGSLFTHTSRELTGRWMAHLARFLSPQGIVVATVHGRWSEQVHKQAPYIDEGRWQKILEEYSATGYGYQDYCKEDSHNYISGSYGVSLARPHVIVEEIERIPAVRLFMYMERGWGEHQDVVVFGRPDHAKPW